MYRKGPGVRILVIIGDKDVVNEVCSGAAVLTPVRPVSVSFSPALLPQSICPNLLGPSTSRRPMNEPQPERY